MKIISGIGIALTLTALLGACSATVKKNDDVKPVRVGANATKAIVLNMTGGKDATDSKDWGPFKDVWREALQEEAGVVGATVSTQEGEAKPTGAPGTLLAVNVADFRYVSTGARIGFGVMTGNAFVNAQVSFRDLNTGDVWGERQYDTASSAWQGVFAPMTDKQVHAICKEIVTTLSNR